jgi:2-polyprenyl-3-methyl-5-hydroxy-6-metoxy-1,4-benzoquinol methylase
LSHIPKERLRGYVDLPKWRLLNHQLRKAEIVREVRHFPSESRVLDVGCAGGDIALEIAALGYRVKGIDFDPRRLETARRLAAAEGMDVPFEQSDAARLAQLGERYDLIILGEILEHFYEPWKILEEVAAVCRPGAHFIATTPNMASLRSRLKLLLLGMFPDHNPEHRYYYTRRRFREMLAKSPFEMVRARTVVPALVNNLGPLTILDRTFWRGVNTVARGIGENLLVVGRLRG